MNDLKIIVRLLYAIEAGQGKPVFDISLVDERVLKATAEDRDRIALQLRDAGYITGLKTLEGIDNMDRTVILWNKSHPEVTLEGLTYMQENKPFREALKELKDFSVAVAAQTLANLISGAE